MSIPQQRTPFVLGLLAAALPLLPRGSAGGPGPAKPPDRDALLAFAGEPLRFETFCFSGDAFPACRVEHPEADEPSTGSEREQRLQRGLVACLEALEAGRLMAT